jgi:hypothetical protein
MIDDTVDDLMMMIMMISLRGLVVMTILSTTIDDAFYDSYH